MHELNEPYETTQDILPSTIHTYHLYIVASPCMPAEAWKHIGHSRITYCKDHLEHLEQNQDTCGNICNLRSKGKILNGPLEGSYAALHQFPVTIPFSHAQYSPHT